LNIQSFVIGEWVSGDCEGQNVFNAINGEPIGEVSTSGIDFQSVINYARDKGQAGLQNLTFHERADKLKALAKYLTDQKEKLYDISALTGATRIDSWVDIEGGTGTLFAYSSLTKNELPNKKILLEGGVEGLSKEGSFIG